MARDADDETVNPSSNPHIVDIISERLRSPSRREMLRGGLGLGALSWIGGSSLLTGCGDSAKQMPDAGVPIDGSPDTPTEPPPPTLGFTPVAKSLADTLTVPAGYSFTVLYSLGDPIAAGVPAYANNGSDPASSFDRRCGDHHDGMQFYGLDNAGGYGTGTSDRGLLVLNHEAITSLFLHPSGQTLDAGGNRTVAEEVDREFFLQGVSVIEVKRTGGAWSYVKESTFNRRIHTLTEMEIAGPLRGNAAMITKFSPAGTKTRGTVNNCANGYTPWGTYLTCEENWNAYFRRLATDDANRSAKEKTAFTRYGVAGAGREGWATVAPDTTDNKYGRWNAMVLGAAAADDYRNVANTFGWVVEINPFDPASTPKKRTAFGRFAHEGAWPAKATAGKPLVYYCGDDSRGEYIYKFVSSASWDPADATRSDRLAVGDKYFDSGKLYAAKFNADGTGQWLELAFGLNGISDTTPAFAFADQADVLLHARIAGDTAGATRMDRPEWGAVDPKTGAAYVTLTNNTAAVRTLAATDAANPRHYNDPKTVPGGGTPTPQFGNPNGHIIRWKEPSPEALTFTWDIFLFGANFDADPDNVNLSGLTADNDFSSPDGLWFSAATNFLWIETDDGAYTDVTNCMLLAAMPGPVGDGGMKTITNTDQTAATKQVTTYVGKAPGANLRRFLVGPKDCEITGIAETPDGKALFVNIQHPGEETARANLATPNSIWPSVSAGTRPRSSTIVITKNDGGLIGT